MIIEKLALEEIMEDVLAAYPDECCGFLLGKEDAEERRFITLALPVINSREGDKRRRYEISPADYMKAEQLAEENQLQLLGVYHSHPNHPAIPSEYDRQAAQPYFSYLIISVFNKRGIAHQRSWRLNDEHQFEEEMVLADIPEAIFNNQ